MSTKGNINLKNTVMKKVLIAISIFIFTSVLAGIIYNACKPYHYVVYNVDNVVILKTNDIYEYYQFQEGLNEKNITYTTVYDGVARCESNNN